MTEFVMIKVARGVVVVSGSDRTLLLRAVELLSVVTYTYQDVGESFTLHPDKDVPEVCVH